VGLYLTSSWKSKDPPDLQLEEPSPCYKGRRKAAKQSLPNMSSKALLASAAFVAAVRGRARLIMLAPCDIAALRLLQSAPRLCCGVQRDELLFQRPARAKRNRAVPLGVCRRLTFSGTCCPVGQALPASAFTGSLSALPLRANGKAAMASSAAMSMSAASEGHAMRRAIIRSGVAAASSAFLAQVPALAAGVWEEFEDDGNHPAPCTRALFHHSLLPSLASARTYVCVEDSRIR
jgi:hypothetical protein